MKAIPYEERIRISNRIPEEGQAAVMAGMEQFTEELTVHNLRPAPVDYGLPLKALVFNMERGAYLDETTAFLTDCPALADADIILANELDDGCCRSGCRDNAREIAERLRMNYAFGLEFIELVNPDDPKGYHGNAIFSRWPIRWARALYLPEAYNWYFDRQKRIGGRLAIFALLDVGGRDVGAVCVHLENRTDSNGRARQTRAVLEEADRLFGKDVPVIIGGDFNTNTFDGAKVPEAIAMYEEQKAGAPARDVPAMEALLPLAESFGYEFRSFNPVNTPTRRKPMQGGSLLLQLDWLLARGFDCAGRGMVSTRRADIDWAKPGSPLAAFPGEELSDHNAVWASCRRKAKPRAVLFDMGGTLEDIYSDAESERNVTRKLMDALTALGFAVTDSPEAFWEKLNAGVNRYKKYSQTRHCEIPVPDIWSDYYFADFDFDRARIRDNAELFARIWEVTFYVRKLRPGVPEMLGRLKDAGYLLGIVSNNASFYSVFDMLEQYGIRGYFDNVTVSSVTGFRKPAREIFWIALLNLRVRPEECVYVGDTISRDVVGPQRAGIARTIHIDSALTGLSDSTMDTCGSGADDEISDIRQVADLLV